MSKFSFQSKNIIILFKSFVLGGAEKQGLYLANYLQNKKGCNVYIYSYIKSPNSKLFYQECKKYQLQNLYIKKNPLSASGRFKYIKRRIKIALFGLKLRKHKPDIIIPYLNPPSIIASLCYKLAGAKTTFWHHRGVDYYRNDKLEQKAVGKAPFFIANSPSGREELKEIFEINPSKVFMLPNFVIPNQNTKELESVENKELVIAMIGHFRPEKLQLNLVQAFNSIIKKGYKIKLHLIGNVSDKGHFTAVEKFIEAHDLKQYVHIFHDTDASSILPNIDIGILLSKKEGMPNVIMEYMSYKLPIICTKHSGCITLLGKEYSFYIEDNNDIDTIASKLETLLKDKPLRRKVGVENKNRLQKDFLIETYLDKLATLINTY